MDVALLERAQRGDGRAFADLVEPHRRELHLHCYRMLGSVVDADDLVQETLLAAWRGLASFEGRASVRTWLYRIATRRCLNAIRDARRRPRAEPVPPFEPPAPTTHSDLAWLQPYPDVWLDRAPGPEGAAISRETVGLAFIEVLQRMPSRQAAALLLCDVLGFSRDEAADMTDSTPTSVKGALQRARAAARRPGAGAAVEDVGAEGRLARRFAAALMRDDVDGVVALLTDDAWLAMPPAPHVYRGRADIAAFLRASALGRDGRRLSLTPVCANRQPAFTCHLPAPADGRLEPSGVVVLAVRGDRVESVTGSSTPTCPASSPSRIRPRLAARAPADGHPARHARHTRTRAQKSMRITARRLEGRTTSVIPAAAKVATVPTCSSSVMASVVVIG